MTPSHDGRTSRPTEEDRDPLDVEGPAAPPRVNGELVFTEPWQSRLFATTMTLWQAEHFEWDRFRQGLIHHIAEHQSTLQEPEDYDYWGCWLRALESLLGSLDTVSSTELDRTSEVLAARPAGHDHDHSHSHSHSHSHE